MFNFPASEEFLLFESFSLFRKEILRFATQNIFHSTALGKHHK